VGRGFGCLGIAVDQPQDISNALRQAAEHRGPAVINISVSGEETPVTSYQKALRDKGQQG
jgi:thiamine pyrophosphate-dependent acetolactate synthase large subunit-like protein